MSRRGYVRDGFAVVMRKQEGSATHNTAVTHQPADSFGEPVPKPSHPAFNRPEELGVRQLQEVSAPLSLPYIRSRVRAT